MSTAPPQSRFEQDPSAKLDYTMDWTDWLALVGDSIESSTWPAVDGLTFTAPNHDANRAWVWIAGGTPGEEYRITNHIVTAGGREDDRSITLEIRQT